MFVVICVILIIVICVILIIVICVILFLKICVILYIISYCVFEIELYYCEIIDILLETLHTTK